MEKKKSKLLVVPTAKAEKEVQARLLRIIVNSTNLKKKNTFMGPLNLRE